MSADQNNENKEVNGCYKDVEEVITYPYYIKSYQRGYRWDTNNIKELLEDIFEGKLNKDNNLNDQSNYCLQPLVVKRIRIKGQDKYSVIDGQQRLTSLFIILKALSKISKKIEFPKKFSLEYESREKSGEFLANLEDTSGTDNIDAAYIKQAFVFAKKWFLRKNDVLKRDKDTPDDNDPVSKEMDPELAEHMYKVLKEQTHFIWDEIIRDEIDKKSSTSEQKIFADRNTGKLELTNSELIKSLFMNPEYYGSESIGDRQILISEIWDIYENELHKAEFWAFLPLSKTFKENYSKKTRIDAIFYLFVKSKDKYTYISQEENGLFHAVQEWVLEKIKIDKNDTAKVMHQCWRDVCDLMDGIIELYENNEIYNLLSLYKIVATNNALEMYLNVLNEPKDLRAKYIKREITKILFKGGTSKHIEKTIKETRYHKDNSNKIIYKILIAHNIAVTNTTTPIERFPFQFFESGNSDVPRWDREHIYATNESYINGAGIDEKISVLKKFSGKDSEHNSYRKYINYIYDTDVDTLEKDHYSHNDSDFATNCFKEKAFEKYDKYFDIWRCLKLQKLAGNLLPMLEIKKEIDEILHEIFDEIPEKPLPMLEIKKEIDEIIDKKRKKNIKRKLEYFLQNSEYYDKEVWRIFFENNNDRDVLDKIFDNDGIEPISIDKQGTIKDEIVNDNSFPLLLSFIVNIRCRIEEEESQFFSKETSIDPDDTEKGEEENYSTFSDFINDNSMGNMMLLPGDVNSNTAYSNANLDGKRKFVLTLKQKDVFLPIASKNVLFGKYNDLGSDIRQWLMDERLEYLKDMIDTMTDYFEDRKE